PSTPPIRKTKYPTKSQVPGQLVTMLSWQPNCPGETETQRNGSRTTAVKITERMTLNIANPRNLLDRSIDCMFRTPRQNHPEEGLVPNTAHTLTCQIIKALPLAVQPSPFLCPPEGRTPGRIPAWRVRVSMNRPDTGESMPLNTRHPSRELWLRSALRS